MVGASGPIVLQQLVDLKIRASASEKGHQGDSALSIFSMDPQSN